MLTTLKVFKKRESGFALVELVIALGVLTAIFALTMGSTTKLFRWVKEAENTRKLSDMKSAVSRAYQAQSWAIDADDTATLNLTYNGVAYKLTSGSASTAENKAALQQVASYANINARDAESDVLHNAYLVCVSTRQHDTASNAHFHRVAFVSSGYDATLGKADYCETFEDFGTLNLAGDDIGFVVSGLQYQINVMNDIRAKLHAIKEAYQNYFASLYLADASRNIYIDRFARTSATCAPSSLWDSSAGSVVLNSLCVTHTGGFANLTDTNLKGALGLSDDAVTLLNGKQVLVNNGGAGTRNPSTTGAILPYTAILRAELPWGTFLDVSVVGNY